MNDRLKYERRKMQLILVRQLNRVELLNSEVCGALSLARPSTARMCNHYRHQSEECWLVMLSEEDHSFVEGATTPFIIVLCTAICIESSFKVERSVVFNKKLDTMLLQCEESIILNKQCEKEN